MVCFDKSLTLREKLNEYTKDDLKCRAEIFGKTGLSKLKKAELVELMLKEFLDPEVMFYRMSIYGDDEIEVFEKGFNGLYNPGIKEINICCVLNDAEYAVMSRAGGFIVPSDVVHLWKKVRDDKFEAYRFRASWVWRCLDWCISMYGLFLKSDLLNVVNSRPGFEMKKEELDEILDHFPIEQMWFDKYGEQIVSDLYTDEDELEELINAQAGKGFYIPTVAEVNEMYLEDGIISGKAYQNMMKFLTSELYMSKEDAENILYDTWDLLNTYDEVNETVKWFVEQTEPSNKEQLSTMVSLLMAMANDTRRISNRGYTPDELFNSLKSKDGMAKVTEKKVYPNDPCPCGSGIKYKYCCGKKC